MYVAASAARVIEDRTLDNVDFAMREAGLDWVVASADGLQLRLTGTAPDEAARFRAISITGSLVDGDRIVDQLDVVEPASFTPPPYALEMLRNDDGISLIGLVPGTDGDAIAAGLPDLAEGEVVNMVETADYPVPGLWDDALAFGLFALGELQRAKVSVSEAAVVVEAVSRSPEERARYLETLRTRIPEGVEVILDISAPRPVITPFTLRYVLGDQGRFEACSADTEAARTRILNAARAAGLAGPGACDIGLGLPSPNWTQAVEVGLAALADLGRGSITYSDADVTLVAAEGTPQDLFDRIVGELDAALPDVFSLHAVLPVTTETADEGPPNFTATRDAEGGIELRGRLPDARVEAAVEAYARAQFAGDPVLLATRRVDDLPNGWSVRVLAGLAALSHLSTGAVRIEPDLVAIEGETGNLSAVSDISRLLSADLGEAANFEIDVDYIEALDPATAIPSAQECVDRISAILDETKITFDPGSIEINEPTEAILETIADILPDCRHVQMEIGGHTDAQGSEAMNLRLSQSRADAVLNGLMAHNILIGNLSARGYGETRPIADNDTEEGREINRRIEFRLMTEIEAEDARIAAQEAQAARANLPPPIPRPDREDSE